MIDPTVLGAAFGAAKSLGDVVAFLWSLRGSSKTVDDHMTDAYYFARQLGQMHNRFKKYPYLARSEGSLDILEGLHNCQTICEEYLDLLEDVASSRNSASRALRWRIKESEIERVRTRLCDNREWLHFALSEAGCL